MKPAAEGQKPRKRSLYRGVSAHGNKWKAQINHAGTQYYLGLFELEEDAARAYDRAARIIHAHNAVVNFRTPEDGEQPQEKIRNPTNRLPRDANPALLGVLFRHPRDDSSRRGPVALGHHAQDVELLMNYRAEMQEKIHQLEPLLQNPALPLHFRETVMDDYVACTIRELDASTRIDELLQLQGRGLAANLGPERAFAAGRVQGTAAPRAGANSGISGVRRQVTDEADDVVASITRLRPHQVSASSSSNDLELNHTTTSIPVTAAALAPAEYFVARERPIVRIAPSEERDDGPPRVRQRGNAEKELSHQFLNMDGRHDATEHKSSP